MQFVRIIVVTQASTFMGPDIVEIFKEEGGDVFTDDRDLSVTSAADELIQKSGHVDVLVVNLAAENPHFLL